jgi:outer membrane lipoprotein-sorting protein
MRWLLTAVLLTLACWPARAEENDAERLFRTMTEKVRTAKTLRVRFDLNVTDALGKKWNVKGRLILGEGDKYRIEGDGKLFGEAVKFIEVSDRTRTASKDLNNPKRDKIEKTAAGVGAYFREALPREGFFLSTLNMAQREKRTTDAFKPTDFKLAGKEKIGERDTQALGYKLGARGAEGLSMKMWLDARTNLPAKLAIAGGKSDVTDSTETYEEFTLDPKVDDRLFEVSK